MARTWLPEKWDCSGGINQNAEEIQPNQVLDARNVWCRDGKMVTRPGYMGMFGFMQTSISALIATNTVLKSYDGAAYTTANNGATLDCNGLEPEDYIYIGISSTDLAGYSATGDDVVGFVLDIDTPNNPATEPRALLSYYNGDEWVRISCKELGLDASESGAVPIKRLGSKRFFGDEDDGAVFDTGYFLFARPNEWSESEIDGVTRYWLRLEIFDDTITNLVLNNGNSTGPIISASSLIGLDQAEWASGKSYVFTTEATTTNTWSTLGVSDGIVPDGLFTFGYIMPKGDLETTSFVTLPQWGEAYRAVEYDVKVIYQNQTINKSTQPEVESRPEWVGEVAGVKAEFHPDYVSARATWPKCKYMEFFHGQLWAANLEDNPYGVIWSAPQPAYKVWPTESGEILVEDDSSHITGMKAFGEHLAVFKRDSIWRMVYSGVGGTAGLNTYIPVKVPGGVGTVSNGSIQDINGVLMFLAEDGVYVFNGAQKPEKISGAIDKTIANLSSGRLKYATSAHWRSENCYLLGVSESGSETNNLVLVYDYLAGAWWIWEFENDVASFLIEDGVGDKETLYFADSQSNVYHIDPVHNRDYDVSIDAWFQELLSLGDEYHVTLREIRVMQDNPDAGLVIGIERDYEGVDQATSRSIVFRDTLESTLPATLGTATCAKQAYRRRKCNCRETADTIRVKFLCGTDNQAMSISSVKYGIVPVARR